MDNGSEFAEHLYIAKRLKNQNILCASLLFLGEGMHRISQQTYQAIHS